MKEKEFLDVFPQLRVEPQLEQLLQTVKVMKVAINSRKDMLRVYLISSQWIHKKYIYYLEQQIKNQFFADAKLQVKIIEKFQLSRQYTPENFLEVYRDSILLELKHYSMLEYNMFATAKTAFPETETLHLTLTDSMIAKEKEPELIRILEKIFCERCGFHLKIYTEYQKPVESKTRKNSELRILEEAKHILFQSKIGQKQMGMKPEDLMVEDDSLLGPNTDVPFAEDRVLVAAGGVQGNENGLKTGNTGQIQKSQNVEKKSDKKFEKKEKGNWNNNGNGWKKDRTGDDFGARPLKRSDNPDVIYGKDFEDEVTNIDTVENSMGEVTIRGKITAVDTKEIRNERTIYIFYITDFTDTISVKLLIPAFTNTSKNASPTAFRSAAFISASHAFKVRLSVLLYLLTSSTKTNASRSITQENPSCCKSANSVLSTTL